MKKSILLITMISLFASCTSKKQVVSSNQTENPMENQLAAVNARFPNSTLAELELGKSIYTGACTKCHGTRDVTVYTEPRLLEIVDVMAVKAKITPEEKLALIKFAVGVRATAK